jgi:putative transposase
MIKAHKIRLNPTPEQEDYFKRAAGCARLAYNWALAEWRREYEAGGKPSALDLKKRFNEIKAEQFPFVKEVTKCATEQAFADVGAAFANFLTRLKKGGEAGYPKFKSKNRSTPSFYLANDKITFAEHTVYIPKLGWVNMAESLRLEGKVMGARVRCRAGQWWIAVAVEMEKPPPQEKQSTVGVDVGITNLGVTSDGRVFENQEYLRQSLSRLSGLGRALARKEAGSRNFEKAKVKLQRAHYQVACQRDDAIHKMTTELCRNNAMIGIEDLNVKGMMRNRHLSRSLSDAAFGEIHRQLNYKAEWFGSVVQPVDRFFPSSQLCSACGERKTELTLAEREWQCEACGAHHDRDLNAAINIRDEALRRLGSGYVESLNSPVEQRALA